MTVPGHRDAGNRAPAGTAAASSTSAAADAVGRLAAGILAFDDSLRLQFANLAAARMTGLDPGDLPGAGPRELLTTAYREALEGNVRESFQRQQAGTVQLRLPEDGSMSHRFDPSPSGVTVTINRTETPAALPQPHYREVLDSVAQGVIETTPGGEFLIVNRAFAEMLGYDSADDLARHVRTAGELYVNSGERPVQVRRASLGDADEAVAVEVRRKDGTPAWVRARVTPWFSPTGELVSMQAVLEEVTEQPLTQLALHDVADSIESRERLLLAEVIHDEPLQLLAAALLRLDSLEGNLPTAAASVVGQVVDVLDRATDRLRRLLVTLHPPDLEAGLGTALLAFAQGIFSSDDTMLEQQGPEDVPLPDVAQVAAFRILREALINARRHAHARRVLVSSEVSSDSVVLIVEDDGVGGGDFTPQPGHMGLLTMRARAAAMNAVLTITAQHGAGTVVSLVVPRLPSS